METTPKINSFQHKPNAIKANKSEVSQKKEKTTPSSIIFAIGIIFTAILLLVKVILINFDWKIPFIPLMCALQIIFLLLALKKRYKKL